VRYVDEYRGRDPALAHARAIAEAATRPWRIMEVCGGQTHAIARFGLEELLPPGITLLHGPGCPVCVTPAEVLDRAIALARRPEVVLCSYGDMLRVPGSTTDLRTAKAEGGDVRVVYSALDALALARALPDREVVFLAVGFETTAPGHALAVHQARREGLRNFSLLVAHVLVPPALEAILADDDRARGDHRVDGFLAAGHVCTIMGAAEYEPVARRHRVPIVITGFEPVDILHGLLLCIRQLEAGRAEVENAYARAVRTGGNPGAQAMIREVFARRDQRWRGIGDLPRSGLRLAPAYAAFDAEHRFPPAPGDPPPAAAPDRGCRSGLVLVGKLKPPACPEFGARCTPDHPLGATMVSSEGACAAYYRHRRPAP
jgi:hydrogenase expression/formation protein HypD